MEDKVAIIENIDMFFYRKNLSSQQQNNKKKSKDSNEDDTSSSTRRPSSLFAVFDGHCGLEASHYVSVHLPIYLIQHPQFEEAFYDDDQDSEQINQLISQCFDTINTKFSKKAEAEVKESALSSSFYFYNINISKKFFFFFGQSKAYQKWFDMLFMFAKRQQNNKQ